MRTYGSIVAARWKKAYFKRKKWYKPMSHWTISPEEYYTILKELKSKRAIIALVGAAWTRNLPVDLDSK